ncbi:MAG: hypothetical protein QOJ03_2675, partial [Frankiaceae bacterium]|nr:hypothetical protein [Frankiaceae bacterium]
APHVEQRLGPVDAVIADPACALLLEQVFAPDLRRRGHGGVVTLAVGAEPADVLRLLSDML